MAAVPRSLLTIGASLLSARAGARLRRKGGSAAAQDRVFSQLIPKLAQGSAWQEAGVEPGMTYDDYRDRVPLQAYRDIEPHVGRMMRGEPNVLWPGKCQIYSTSAGTTDSGKKYIPV